MASGLSLPAPRAAYLKALDKADFEQSHLRFTQRFFHAHKGSPLVIGQHHAVVANTLDRVLKGEITRLIINIPPRFTKTEMAVVHFIAHGFALNARANFVHASFSSPLALQNSDAVREVMKLPAYQEHWPLDFSATSDNKGRWMTAAGGGMLAAAAGGTITGFGAGLMEPGFTGALIIDDPLKPDDASSDVLREHVNSRWHSTFKSRLALESVPVIVIMQRLHVDDFSGFLLKGGADVKWHHLLLPVEVDNAIDYPPEYTHGIPIPHGLPDGPLWSFKLDEPKIEVLRANPYVFTGQYLQVPTVSGGNLFKAEGLVPYDFLPALAYRVIYVDTAQKTAERNDYSVFQCWGMGKDGCAYLLDQMRGKWEAPELEKNARAFWKKHKAVAWNTHGALRSMKIEDKASGTGLIQSLRRPPDPIIVVPIPRAKDKVVRANDTLPAFAAGLVRHPAVTPATAWVKDWITEMLAFPADSHDDQVDPTMDAVSDMLVRGPSMMDVLE